MRLQSKAKSKQQALGWVQGKTMEIFLKILSTLLLIGTSIGIRTAGVVVWASTAVLFVSINFLDPKLSRISIVDAALDLPNAISNLSLWISIPVALCAYAVYAVSLKPSVDEKVDEGYPQPEAVEMPSVLGLLGLLVFGAFLCISIIPKALWFLPGWLLSFL